MMSYSKVSFLNNSADSINTFTIKVIYPHYRKLEIFISSKGFLRYMTFITETRLVPGKLEWFITLGPSFSEPVWRAPKLRNHVFTHFPKRVDSSKERIWYGWQESVSHRGKRSSVKELRNGKRKSRTCITNWNQCGWSFDHSSGLHCSDKSTIWWSVQVEFIIALMETWQYQL